MKSKKPFNAYQKTKATWYGVLWRCSAKATGKVRALYFDRGIRVCERWLSFENFLADMGERPEGKTIDRYPDRGGNYEPSNCRWATSSEQNKNRDAFLHPSPNPVEWQGQTKAVRDWERDLGFGRGVVSSRISRGWSVEEALSTPVRRRSIQEQRA